MELEKVVSRGGYKTHLKPVGQWNALCGFAPSVSTGTIFYKTPRWYKREGFSDCAKCKQKAAKHGTTR